MPKNRLSKPLRNNHKVSPKTNRRDLLFFRKIQIALQKGLCYNDWDRNSYGLYFRKGGFFMIVAESSEMRTMEDITASCGIPMSSLMEKAGQGVAELAGRLIKEKQLKNICIVCGTGNNGGDGFVTARLLCEQCGVCVILADGFPKTELAQTNFSILPPSVEVHEFSEHIYESIEKLKQADMIIDAVYGIGFHNALKPNVGELIGYCNENKHAVKIAVDVPSGILCDSGSIITTCFHADYTVSFTALKPLHVLYPSMDFCGELSVVDVGIPKNIFDNCNYIMKTTDEFIQQNPIRPRRKSAHKGTNGTLLAVCGSYGMAGAAMLAGEAALRTGVGLLKMAVPRSVYPIVAQKLTEAVFMPLEQTTDGKINFKEYNRILFESVESASAILIGCGMGINDGLKQMMSMLVENSTKPMVIDADGLNCLCGNIDILRRAAAPIIITPHPGEMAKLINSDIQTIQAYRYDVAKDFAQEYRVTVVLKGADTIIATPEGKVYVNLTGNNGMAKGGSGDVLAGMMSSLLAQGLSTEKAAAYAVYYHGIAGDKCAEKLSVRTMLPSDLIKEIDF